MISTVRMTSKHPTIIKEKQKQTILATINKNMAIVYLMLVMATIPITWLISSYEARQNASREMENINSFVSSVRKHVREDNSDYFIKQNEWHLTAVSPIVAAKAVAKRYTQENPNVSIRFVSDNPLNFENIPNAQETNMLLKLRGSQSKRFETTAMIGQEKYLMQATPELVKTNCTACHGDRATAPKAQLALYNGDSGYNWKVGETVGATIVGVKMANVTSLTLNRTMIIAGGATVIFALLLLIVNQMLRQILVKPIVTLTDYAEKVALGQKATIKLEKRNDEIGTLTGALERLQLSFRILEQRQGNKTPNQKIGRP
jgi:HAMP domain-containing protein